MEIPKTSHAADGKTPVKVQAPIDVAVQPDQAINLRFDEATLRWMDAGTGSAIPR